ncbi:hypothetical protein OTU49_004882, partial [Cherax quadricarinatus]
QYRGHGVTECVLVTTAHWARLTVVARETCVVGRGSEGTIMAEVRPESVDSDDDFVYVTEAGLEQAPRPEEKGLQVPSQSPPLKLKRAKMQRKLDVFGNRSRHKNAKRKTNGYSYIYTKPYIFDPY